MSLPTMMCPYCGCDIEVRYGLTAQHLEHVRVPPSPDMTLSSRVCQGSSQNPRDPSGDMRTLWNGQPAPAHLRAAEAGDPKAIAALPQEWRP